MTITPEHIETVQRLAEAAAAARRYSSDTAADAAGEALAQLLEEGDNADTTPQALARKVAAAVARLHRADTRSLRLAAAAAERQDRTPVIPWEQQSTDGRKTTAAGLTAGDVDRFTKPGAVDAVLAAHSGPAPVLHRNVSSTTLRSAERITGALPAHLVDVLAPQALTDETGIMRRPVGARWSRVSTARGEYVEIGVDTDGAARYGLDDGSVRGIRHRDSDAGNGSHTLAIVHSAEAQTIRAAHTDALALAACLPWQPTAAKGKQPPAARVAAWLRLCSGVSNSHAPSLAEYLDAFAIDPQRARSGRVQARARLAWSALANEIGTSPKNIERTLAEWAEHVRAEASSLQRARLTEALPDHARGITGADDRFHLDRIDPLPNWTSPPRGDYRTRTVSDFTVTASGDALRLSPVVPADNRPSHEAHRTDSSLTPHARTARPGLARDWKSADTEQQQRRAHARSDSLAHSGPAPTTAEPLARLIRDSRQ